MKTLRVGFSSHSSIFSKLIKFFTSSDVSHTYIRIPVPEYSTSVVFQASYFTVHYLTAQVFEAHADIIEEYEIEVSDEQYLLSEKFRVTEVGKPYSYTQILGFLWVLVNRKFGRKIHNPLSNGNSAYVCVEVVTNCIGLPDGECMTPEDFRCWCIDNAKLVYQKPF